MRLRRGAVEVGEEAVAQVVRRAERLDAGVFLVPRLVVVVPVVLLAPGREEAEVDAGGIQDAVLEDGHVAALVGVAADREVEAGDHAPHAAAGVAGPGRHVALDAGVAAGGVDHRTAAGVRLVAFAHLLGVDERVEVVVLVVGAAVRPLAR